MPWFSCDICCDTVKKPKVEAHSWKCQGATFTCIDCSRTFDAGSVKGHQSCVTETQKYVEGATKAGGTAATGFYQDKAAAQQHGSDAAGQEYLSRKPPWQCTVCNVSCTSEATLLAHASGVKHKRRVRAAQAAAAPPVDEATPADAASAAPANHTAKDGTTATAATHAVEREKRKSTADAQEAQPPVKQKRHHNHDDAAIMPVKPPCTDAAAHVEQDAQLQLADTVRTVLQKRGKLSLSKLVKLVSKKRPDLRQAPAKILEQVLLADGKSMHVLVSPATSEVDPNKMQE